MLGDSFLYQCDRQVRKIAGMTQCLVLQKRYLNCPPLIVPTSFHRHSGRIKAAASAGRRRRLPASRAPMIALVLDASVGDEPEIVAVSEDLRQQ